MRYPLLVLSDHNCWQLLHQALAVPGRSVVTNCDTYPPQNCPACLLCPGSPKPSFDLVDDAPQMDMLATAFKFALMHRRTNRRR